MRKSLCALSLTMLLLFTSPFLVTAHGETFQGWQVLNSSGGILSESNGTIRFFGAGNSAGGPTIYREFSPQTDFQFSLQVKAMQLGINGPVDNLEGFGILLRNSSSTFNTPIGASLEMRGASGGMFLLARYTTFWQWTSFYGAYSSWGAPYGVSSPAPTAEAPFGMFGMYPTYSAIETDVWYTMKLSVQKSPFIITGEVFNENGTLLGSHSISDSTNFTFEDIKYIAISSAWGGDFYVKNISDLPPLPQFSYSPTETAAHYPVIFDASNSSNPQGQIASYTWGFGDGTIKSTFEPTIEHTFPSSGTFNVTLTVVNTKGKSSSTSQLVHVLLPSFLSMSIDSSSAVAGAPVNINGRLSDYNGVGLANEPVVLSYRFAGVTSWLPVTSAYTDQTGNYAIQWISPASGTFTLQTAWQGNETYKGASNVSSLSSLPYTSQTAFFVESNSTVTSLAFNSTTSTLSFSVSGVSGTLGYLKATIAKSIVPNSGQIGVYLDGNSLNYSLASEGDTWLLTFNYHHSTHRLNLFLGDNKPEPTRLPVTASASNAEASPASISEPIVLSSTKPFEPWITLTIAFVAAVAAIGIILWKRKR